MAKFRVLITDYAWADLSIERRVLEAGDAELIVAPSSDEPTLIKYADNVDAIMTNWAKTTANVIAAAKGCRIVSRLGIGLDNIDVEYCSQHNIPVTNVPDYCLLEVAEHTIALLLGLARKVGFYHEATKHGRYQLQAGPVLRRVAGQTLGIIGFGNIGRCVAERAIGLGLKVIATSRTPKSAPGVEFCSLEELLRRSDYVSLHAPATAETKHMINAERLKLMKPSSYLINTARGLLIDHDALAAALANDEIQGAALDVQTPEPPDLNKAPYNDPRVIVTPHAAFVSVESLENLRFRTATQVIERLHGRTPENVVNAARVRLS